MATLTEVGLAIKTLQEYLDEIRESHQDIDPGWDISAASPDGLRIQTEAERLANNDETVQRAYASVDPDTAPGAQLDRVARISGIDRQDGSFSTATVTFTGTNGVTIPPGTEVRNSETGTIWETDTSVTISSGEAEVGVTCTTLGPEPAGIGDLSIIATPVAGVSSVTNDASATLGEPVESDNAFRLRRNLSVSQPGSNQVDSMFGRIANVDNVLHVRIYENWTDSTNGNGLDPHSMAVFVNGGDTVEIAEAMAAKKNPGCGLNADNSFANKVQESVTTPEGSPFDATFYRPALTDIHIEIDVSGSISSEQETRIKEAIVEYAEGGLFGNGISGFDKTGFAIGETVPAGKLYTPVNQVIGGSGYVNSIQLGTSSGSINQSSIDPGFNGLAVFDTNSITVTVS